MNRTGPIVRKLHVAFFTLPLLALMAFPPQPSNGSDAPALASLEKNPLPPKKEGTPANPRDFWSFQTPRRAPLPSVKQADWPRTDLDHFILAKLEAQNLKPVADATRGVWLRRVYFDLIGLPPSPQEMDAFLKDESPKAREAVVDHLLASRQFGERWGRYWLDVARYAESTGKERNFTYPDAWRYRDYVIASFNADKPYDQFVREQIAGDLLASSNDAERNERLIATGFLALGPKGLNEKNREQFTMDMVDEQIDATTRAVLGLTVACARCHDHKFDPIAQSDYYALAGIFKSTRTFYGTSGAQNRNASSLLPLAETAPPSEISSTESKSETEPAAPALDRVTAGKGKNKVTPARIAARLAAADPAQKARLMKRLQMQTQAAPAAASAATTAPQAMGAQEGRPADCSILVRGEIDHRGPMVSRGFVNVLAGEVTPNIPADRSGRLELADWLTRPDNPLTARVMANRVWMHLFGQGLVRTPDNFGANGERPSHPELLDYLATQFTTDGWSVKRLIRGIVLSRVYQLGSAIDARAVEADPDNVLLWRASPRRLDAESIRDAMLAASGQLDLAPMRASVVAQVGDGYVGRGIPAGRFNVSSNKRSVYLPIVRDAVPDVLDLFDFAEPSLVVAVRDVTNVPAQALYLMNSPFVVAQSRALAKRLLSQAGLDHSQRVALAYQLTLSRAPTEAELARGVSYVRAESSDGDEAAWANFCQALLASAEFRYVL
jgi:hypothetical protein